MTREVGYARYDFCLEARVPARQLAGVDNLGPMSRINVGVLDCSPEPRIAGTNDGLIAVLDADFIEHMRNVIAHGFF